MKEKNRVQQTDYLMAKLYCSKDCGNEYDEFNHCVANEAKADIQTIDQRFTEFMNRFVVGKKWELH